MTTIRRNRLIEVAFPLEEVWLGACGLTSSSAMNSGHENSVCDGE